MDDARFWGAVYSTENWMAYVAAAGREIPLDLVRAYLMFRFGLRRST